MMKKWITLLLISGLFVSCGNAQNHANRDSSASMEAVVKKSGCIKITKADFLKKIANYEEESNVWKYLGDKPAIVDFYADWCGPCRSVAPILEDLAEEYKGQIYVYKVNTDKEQDLSAALGIVSLPSLLFIPMEGQPQMAAGALPKEKFKEIIEQFLLKK